MARRGKAGDKRMLERVYERLLFDLGDGVKCEIWHTTPKAPYVCRITFADGRVADSRDERLSWRTVAGAQAWAKHKVQEGA